MTTSLSPRHVDYLTARAVDPDAIAARYNGLVRYESIVARPSQHPDLQPFANRHKRCGLLIRAPGGGVQLRPDNPPAKHGNPIKFLSPSGLPLVVDRGPHTQDDFADVSRPVLLVEGLVKADAVRLAMPEALVVGIIGCWGWSRKASGGKKLAKDLLRIHWAGRRVYIIMDADVETNEDVALASRRLCECMTALDAKPAQVRVPVVGGDATTGIDDWLASLAPQARKKATQELLAQAVEHVKPLPNTFDRADYDSVGEILRQYGVTVRVDKRSNQQQFLGLLSDQWQPANTRQIDALRTRMERDYYLCFDKRPAPYVMTPRRFEQLLNAHSPTVDAFEVWLESLPDWDRIERVDFILNDLFGTPITDLNRFASRLPFITAVARTIKPGRKADTMLVLISQRGGTGKSSLYRAALPEQAEGCLEWFVDGVSWTADGKEFAEAARGRVIIEMAEMTGLSRAETERVKVIISSQDDGAYRMAYERENIAMPRRYAFVGTSNNPDLLPNDPSGNRRFLPVTLPSESHDLVEYMTHNRDQIWAEALHLVRHGAEIMVPRHLHQDALDRAEQHRNRDELLEDVLQGMRHAAGDGYTLLEIAQRLKWVGPDNGTELTAAQTKRLSKALRNADWAKQRQRVDGKRAYRWAPA